MKKIDPAMYSVIGGKGVNVQVKGTYVDENTLYYEVSLAFEGPEELRVGQLAEEILQKVEQHLWLDKGE